MSTPKLLIIEDNQELQTLLRLLLTHHHFEVCAAFDGKEGLQQFYQQQPDLVLLDLKLPHVDGWEILRLLHLLSDVPVVIMSGLAGKSEIERGLRLAADYLVKPFSIHEIVPRLQAVLAKRARPVELSLATIRPRVLHPPVSPSPLLHSTPAVSPKAVDVYLQIDLHQRRVYVNGRPVRLTDVEFRLLECLTKQAGRVLTYQQILAAVWGWTEGRNSHYVHVHVSRLRQKLEKDPKDPQYLLTEHGVGYWLHTRGLNLLSGALVALSTAIVEFNNLFRMAGA